jgi:threonine aldolase
MADAVDLRSDTVTQPSAAMREAISNAAVGDDVYGEDPTVNRLQEVVAQLLGVEAALFVPTGSMANQIAIKIHTQPGDEILAGGGAHSWLFESGATGALAGVQICLLDGDGRFAASEVRKNYKPDNHHYAPTKLVAVENTHNMGGGLVWQRDDLADVLKAAAELELKTHLDGARLWNAALASKASESELAAGFDTISVCLSKGLGAPVGSLLAGSSELMHKAHRVRKMLGGGMRQAGILAAAGLYALEHNRQRMGEDHDNASYLAKELSALQGLDIDLDRVHSNIIMVDVAPECGSAAEIAQRARKQGVLFVSLGPQRFRIVTHLDVNRADCTRAVEVLADVVRPVA